MMKKLITLCSLVALTAGLAACKTSKTEPKEQPAVTKPTEETKPTEAKPTEAKPDEAKPDEAKPTEAKPATTGDLPSECADYKAAIDALASCDKLPAATRDAFKQSYDQASASWASQPAEGKAALATACKSGADAVKQAAAACK